MIRRSFVTVFVLVMSLFGLVTAGVAQDLAITGSNVYSSPDAPLRKHVTVLIRHGVIAGVGEHLRIPGASELPPVRTAWFLQVSEMRMCTSWRQSGSMQRTSPPRN